MTSSWPAGATWVCQGTVLEDATAGTHVCTLTVTPGTGNEMQVLYGRVLEGNSATAQTCDVYVEDDSANRLTTLVLGSADTSANTAHVFPVASTTILAVASQQQTAGGVGLIVSGTMNLILKVTTTAVSITQTFAVACRIRGAAPTATLADTVGTPTLTINTNRVF